MNLKHFDKLRVTSLILNSFYQHCQAELVEALFFYSRRKNDPSTSSGRTVNMMQRIIVLSSKQKGRRDIGHAALLQFRLLDYSTMTETARRLETTKLDNVNPQA